MVQPLWKRIWQFLKKLKIELPYDPATLLLGIYTQKNGKQNLEELLVHPCFIALFTIAKMWKQPKFPSLDERISKVW